MSAEDPGSITRWLSDLKAGRPEAVDAIWRRYYHRVLGLARRRLRQAPPQAVADVEDVALSAFNGLAAGARAGRFEHIEDRADLWHVLAAITVRKALRRGEWYDRWKRSGRPPQDDGVGNAANNHHARTDPAASFPSDSREDENESLGQVASKDPIPEVAIMLREQLDQLLAHLDDPVLRQVAGWRMEGLTNAEIARRLGCARRTVERKVELIRLTWEHLGAEDSP